jgi:DNA-binding LacI/PurR family transcriptional regulator
MTTSKKPKRTSKTMDDIARLAGVSKPTVSRVMNGSPLVNEETRNRVLEVARRHGYRVNRSAQRLRSNRANTIALVVDIPSLPGERISQPFHFELLADVFKALSARHQDVLLRSPEADDADYYRDMIASKAVDGIIFLGQGTRLGALRDLARAGVPFVAWGAPDEAGSYCTVGSDNFRGGFLIGEHLAQSERRKIVFVGPTRHGEIALRRQGVEAGLKKAGYRFRIDDVDPADLSYDAARRAFDHYLQTGTGLPDAVVGGGDTIAMAAGTVLRERNISMPDKVRLIGYDDIPQAAQFIPPLTTVRQDTRLAGLLLAEKVMQKVDGYDPQSATLPTELVIRNS